MDFPAAPQYESAILRQYEKNISGYPVIHRELNAFLAEKPTDFTLCMKYLYGHMAAQDMLSLSPETAAGYVEATLDALARIPYLQEVPPEVFFPYVLFHRVNSEYIDNSRGYFLDRLLPHVLGKTMEQAALAVNYWCYAHATYTPADDRTLGPLAVIARTLGRCGEESVLAVSALRSVGIPARQCYCPRWSHCDDNHAWVEVWIRGSWHYLGACEPEPVLDRGWFTAAASRAMLVDTKCWADWEGDALYRTVNCIRRYTHPRVLTVRVTDLGIPVSGARVAFQVVNYSQLYSLWETVTDAKGEASFETGPGDLLVFARYGEKVALEKADLRLQDTLTLELKHRFPDHMTADLVPPEDHSGEIPCPEDPLHRERLALCQAHLAERRASFHREDPYLSLAVGNAPEIRAFLADSRYPSDLKTELLDTLRPKDFVDITHDTLSDALESAMSARSAHPPAIFRNYILAPRIANEMLQPERMCIRALFPQGFRDPRQILDWMRQKMQILPDNGIRNYDPSPLGCLLCRQVPVFAFDLVFVALCRAFSFPAGLEPHTGTAQWLDGNGIWQSLGAASPTATLTLDFPRGKVFHYCEHFTLAMWNGLDFDTLDYTGLQVEGSYAFHLRQGLYRISVTTRQIDGTASVILRHINLKENRQLRITSPEDQTAQRLKKIPIRLPAGPLRDLLEADPRRGRILIFADPGSEPTEHLLREMLDSGEDFRNLRSRILLIVERLDDLAHPTLQLLKAEIPGMEFCCLRDPDALAALHRQMQVGDLRLPFTVCTDESGDGIYADANYRIHMARTLLDIQKLCPRKGNTCRES